ncbi:MAG: type pilus assembly protein PilA [Actinomycetota bacterium]|nr:type pilus assembly protein PilA [Actinomycetota bacterium]
MLTRPHRTPGDRDEGFTLVELLVVMVIIGILSAIAVPVFLNQRQKAQDTATKSDVSNAGQQLATYYVDNDKQLTAAVDAATHTLTFQDGATNVLTVKISDGTAAPGAGTVLNYVAGAGTTCPNATGWSIHLYNKSGDKKDWWYSSQGGLSSGTTAPTLTCT